MTDERPYTIRETLAAMVLEHDAGGITMATLREARQHLSEDDDAVRITPAMIAEWRGHQGHGMISAVGEYTPNEFWVLLDAYERLLAATPEPPVEA